MAFSMVSFEDIPWETIVNFIAPNLTIKEFGALAMQNKFLRELFYSNDGWKRLYVNTCLDKLTITEKSVHVGPLMENHKAKRVVGLGKTHHFRGYQRWAFVGPDNYDKIYDTHRNLKCCGCVADEDLSPLTGQIRRSTPTEELDHWCTEEVFPKIRQYNRKKYGVDCMCTNKRHYLVETLEAPKNFRNFKDYRKQTLSKTLTSVKDNKEIKAMESTVCRNKKKIKNYERAMAELQKLNMDNQVHISMHKRDIRARESTICRNKKEIKKFERAMAELQKLNMDNQVHISKSKRLMDSLKHAIGK